MKVIVKLTVPNIVYRFYRDASRNIAGSTPENLMSDSLTAYASLLSKSIAEKNLWNVPDQKEATSLPGIK